MLVTKSNLLGSGTSIFHEIVSQCCAEIDCNSTAIALQDSFVDDGKLFSYTEADYRNMAEVWIDIEDQPEVLNAICDGDAIEKLETSNITKLSADDGAADDDEPEAIQAEPDQSMLLTYIEATEAELNKLSLGASSLGITELETSHSS